MIGHLKSQIHSQPTLVNLPIEGNTNNLGSFAFNFNTTGTVSKLNEQSPPLGKYSAGVFATSDYLTGSSDFNTLLKNNYSAHSIEFLFKANSIANGPCIFSYRIGTTLQYNTIRVLANGAIRIIINNASFSDSSAGLVTTGQWYVYGYTYDGNTAKGYVSPYPTRKSVPDVTVSASTSATTVETYVGRNFDPTPGIELPLDGYIKNIKVYPGIKTLFPQGA